MRRLKFLRASTTLLMDWFRTERPEVAHIDNNLPADCRIVAVDMDPMWPHTIRFYVESDEFDPVPEGSPVPECEAPIYYAL